MSRYTLMTGATGLLGEYLLKDLLVRGYRLALVVRPGRKESVHQRIETILQMWERQLGYLLPRPVCFEGDVSAENLGLDAAARRWIAENCDRVLHNAAVLSFHGEDRSGEPWRTNLGGTRNVLELCRDAGIEDLHYVSTAYVCGKQDELVYEDTVYEGHEFRNDYEQSKYEAEVLVRQAHFIKKLTVYRPAVIVGDSKSGYTATYHGLHMYLKLMTVMIGVLEPDENGVRHTPLHLPCSGNEPRNTVTVDWVSEVMARLFHNPEAHGQTFHITPDEGFTARQLIRSCEEYFNATGTVFDADEIGMNDFDRMSHEHLSIYHGYLTTDPTYDRTNVEKYVPGSASPKVDKEMIHRFLRFGEEDRWGKRRRPTVKPPLQLRDIMAHARSREQLTDAAVAMTWPRDGSMENRTIGLDVLGPGGGQFQLNLIDDRLVSAEEGLPSDGAPVVRMTSVELASRLGIEVPTDVGSQIPQNAVQECETDAGTRETVVSALRAINGFAESSDVAYTAQP